ncbi:MAG: AIR synthase-related protein, partial [Rhodobiaceae bacterium]
LGRAGGVRPVELARTFNCGIGMLIFVAEEDAETCLTALRESGEPAWVAGGLVARGDGPAVDFLSLDSWPTTS